MVGVQAKFDGEGSRFRSRILWLRISLDLRSTQYGFTTVLRKWWVHGKLYGVPFSFHAVVGCKGQTVAGLAFRSLVSHTSTGE